MHYTDSHGNEWFAVRSQINGIVRVVKVTPDGKRTTVTTRSTYLGASSYARKMGKL